MSARPVVRSALLAILWVVGWSLLTAVMVVLHLLNRGVRVAMGTEADVTPGVQPPDLAIADEPLPDDGPVLIQIEYQIERQNRKAFLRAIHAVETTRRRNGATSWRVFRDLAEDGRFVERYVIASWAEYIRLRSRMTMGDRKLQQAVEQFQRPGTPIRVSRLIGLNEFDVESEEGDQSSKRPS